MKTPKAWLSHIGKKGGAVSSPAKARSSAINGKLGGRPKGSKNKSK